MGEIPAKSDVEVRKTERESRAGDLLRARSPPAERLVRTAIGLVRSAALNSCGTFLHRTVRWQPPSRQLAGTISFALR